MLLIGCVGLVIVEFVACGLLVVGGRFWCFSGFGYGLWF